MLSVWLLIGLVLMKLDRDVASRHCVERARVAEAKLERLRAVYAEEWRP